MRRRGAGEGSVYKRGSDNRWVATVELPPLADGKRRRKTVSGKTKQEALKKQKDAQRQYGVHGDLPTSSMPLSEWLAYWLTEIAFKEVRVKTFTGYEAAVRLHINPVIGRIPLDKLTVAHVRLAVSKLDDKPSTSLRVYRVLDGALKVAVQEGNMTHNPASRMKPPKYTVGELEAMNPNEMVQLMSSVIENKEPMAALWLTYCLTGARRGELLGLRWEDVSDEIDLSWQMQALSPGEKIPSHQEAQPVQGSLWRTRPKSRAGRRVIPLVEPLASILARHREDTGGEGLVFTRAGEPLHPDVITREWQMILARSGIKKHIRLHDVRHSTVDLLYEAGVPEVTIQAIVGHSSRAITRGYKSNANRFELMKAMSAISGLVGHALPAAGTPAGALTAAQEPSRDA